MQALIPKCDKIFDQRIRIP